MRCFTFTLLISVTLFYSLSFVNAIPHALDEKRHRLHKRQAPAIDSSSPAAKGPTLSRDPQLVSSTPVTVSPSSMDTSQSLDPSPASSSVSSSTSTLLSTSDPSSPTPSPSALTSNSLSSSSTLTITQTLASSTSSPPIVNNFNTPVSTSYRHFSSTATIPTDTQSAEGNVATGTGAGTSFLKNKAAMGSTFAIVGIIGAALLVGALFFVTKKLRQRKDEEDFETYFEKLPANHGNNASSREIGGGNDYGLGPSAADLTSPANSQTYMSRDVHYGPTGQYPNQFANHDGLEYPPDRGSVVERPSSYAPGTAYAAAMLHGGQYRYEAQVQDPNMVPNHPFADPNVRRY